MLAEEANALMEVVCVSLSPVHVMPLLELVQPIELFEGASEKADYGWKVDSLTPLP